MQTYLILQRQYLDFAVSESHWKRLHFLFLLAWPIFPQLWLDLPDLWHWREEERLGPGRTQEEGTQELVMFIVDSKLICGPGIYLL